MKGIKKNWDIHARKSFYLSKQIKIKGRKMHRALSALFLTVCSTALQCLKKFQNSLLLNWARLPDATDNAPTNWSTLFQANNIYNIWCNLIFKQFNQASYSTFREKPPEWSTSNILLATWKASRARLRVNICSNEEKLVNIYSIVVSL